jgi:tetratricopeptide (TPR) repeat protein/O-antigen ligase
VGMAASETEAAPWRLTASATWLSLTLCYFYLLLYGGTAHALLDAWPHAIVRGLAVALILYCASVLLRRHLPLESLGGGVDWAVIGVGVVAGATTATAADALRSWENLGLLGAYGLLLYLTVNWCRWQQSVLPLVRLLAVGNVLVCAAANLLPWLGPILSADPLLNLAGYRVYPLGHWNLTGSYIVLTAPLLVGLAVRPAAGRAQLGWWAAAALALMTVLQSGSRIAVIVAISELVIAGSAWLLRSRRIIGRTALGMLAVALIIGSIFEGSNLWSRLAVLSDTGVDVVAGRALSDESAAQRLDIWRGAWSSWHWFGNGLDSVPVQFGYDLLQSPRFPTFSTPNLHNTYLNLLYELGLPGLLAILLMIALLMLSGWQIAARDDDESPLILGALWGLGGYAVTLLVLFHAQVPAMLVTAVLVAAVCLGRGQGEPLAPLRPFLALNVCLSLLVVGVPFATSSYAFWHYNRALELWQSERGPALEHLREGVIYNPLELFPRLAAGMALAQQPSRADREEALQQLEWVNVRTALPLSRLIAGKLALDLGETTRAVSELETAVRLRYYAGLYHWQLAQAYLANRREQAAIISMSRAVLFSPVLLEAAIWDEPTWQRLRNAVLEHCLATAEAQLSTRSSSAEMSYRLGRLMLALGRHGDARAMLQDAQRLAATPDADQQPALQRRIAYAIGLSFAREGRAAEAQRWWQQALQLDPADPATMWQIGRHLVAQGDGEQGQTMLSQALKQWQRLDPTLTAADLQSEQAWRSHDWLYVAERQERWFNDAFQRPAPPFLGFPIAMKAEALCFAGEWQPWLHMPKLKASTIDRSLLAPAGT